MKKFIDFMAMGIAAIVVVAVILESLMSAPSLVLIFIFGSIAIYGLFLWLNIIIMWLINRYFS